MQETDFLELFHFPLVKRAKGGMDMKKLLALLLSAVSLLQLCACASGPERAEPLSDSQEGRIVNLMAQIEATQPADPAAPDASCEALAAEFAVALLQNSRLQEDENFILSPYSILCALAMTANGAQRETLAQMEEIMGMSSQELNRYLYQISAAARQEMVAANSIWFREGFNVASTFLESTAGYYGAAAYQAPFDGLTVQQMNEWVSQQTGGRIEEIIQELNEDDRMVLLNALAFDGVWMEPYAQEDIQEGSFTAADGTMQTVQMMSSTEHSYLQDSLATGFIKEYENGYCFVALLPNEGVSMEDYLASLTGAGLLSTIENSRTTRVSVSMPMLEAETSLSLKEVLTAMGMELPFSSMADFSAMGQGDLYLSDVLHKTSLKIDEQGTQAGASTSAIVTEKSASRSLSVVLNRPYVMAIMDSQTGTVLFMGVVNQIP